MTSTLPSSRLHVAMVGHSFMGAAHSQAWRTAGRFFDLPLSPVMKVLGGRDTDRTAAAAANASAGNSPTPIGGTSYAVTTSTSSTSAPRATRTPR